VLSARSIGLVVSTTLSLLFGASAPTVDVPCSNRSYRLKLEPFTPTPGRPVGLLIKVRINGGPLLSLLLDSGAQYVALNRKAAMKAGCAGGSDLDVVGAGAPSPALAKMLSAGTIEIGDLTLRSVPMVITGSRLIDGIDGVLPLSLFAEFVVRLDIPGKSLDLVPYPTGQAHTAGSVSAVSSNNLLSLKCVLNDKREGYFLIDTGAAYNAISRKVARQLNSSEALASSIPVHGSIAAMDAPLLPDRVQLRFGSRELAVEPVVVIDLSMASRYHNLEVAGLIGYPALRDSVLIVNYRDGLVRLDPR
jgi:predicted aspartyl protease